MTRITTGARLHFGLFHVPHLIDVPHSGRPVRAFGGVGLMVEPPTTVVAVRPADAWQCEGPLASRAQVFAQRLMAGLEENERRPFQVLVERCAPEHVGLGVGTQLGLAVAKGLATELGLPTATPDLAERVGRGERSAVGVHGFDRGGLILEAGKLPGEAVSPLVARAELPAAWRVVLFTPKGHAGWHGDRERRAFDRPRNEDQSLRLAERLTRVARHEMLPAATAGELTTFGEAVHEFNRLAGEPFAAEQGGTYSSGEAAALVVRIRGAGIRGVGQSSWGPTVFAVVENEAEGLALAFTVRRQRPELKIVVARPSTTGAKVDRMSES